MRNSWQLILTALVILLTGCGKNEDIKTLTLNSEDDISGLTVAVQTGSIYDISKS